MARRRNSSRTAYRQPAPDRRPPSGGQRKPPHSSFPPVSVAFFVVLLIYILILLIQYANARTIAGYEVKTGSLSTDQIYTGIALRAESVIGSEYSGYVNYFSKDGDRLGVGNLAYTVDESGDILEKLNSENAGETVLDADDLRDVQTEIVDFTAGFDPHHFAGTYDFRDSLLSTVQKLSGSYILKDINELGASASMHQCYTAETGIVVYSTDGYEGRSFDSVTAEDLSPDTAAAYSRTVLENNQLVSVGDPVYKLCTDENWSVVIAADEERAASLLEDGYVRIRFLKNQQEIWASVTKTRPLGDGKVLIRLDFSNSMVIFCTDRFLRVELLTADETGLKVPNSSIVENEFFLVPKEYITAGPGGTQGVLRETYDEQGKKSTEFISAVPYSETKTEYYLDQTTLRPGDVLDRTDSSETFTLSAMAPLTGVYNINKGYADFRQITVRYANEEYSIVEPNTLYGLSEYDHIVLDASTVTPEALVYG
ncbi:HlyD family efflux transporter periplasmic adaptor subunit [Lachnoclostridium sp. Marseille-P6806]|uniref:HlyD family efflux transporter periplasmic adaptor subunit n=1 Tax=Lachnoclostridium sp. Marseille-P6806 TaxID=2364793 RepID=UPI0013EF4C7A|nr:HlyD family efflux transporter periplasmic adaptor subunit [Lachnoclostridium sp. Marseille-P6806]